MSTTLNRTAPDSNDGGSPSTKRVYRVSTGVTAIAFAGVGVANLAHAEPIMKGLSHLGYPPYFATILGAWKVLAAIAVLAPGLPRAREWAYAGMFFTLTGAALSHAFNRDAPSTWLTPLVLLGVVMTSRACLLRLRASAPPVRATLTPNALAHGVGAGIAR